MSTRAIILIVDDTPAGRQTLEELLDSPDYDLAFACDGPEALAKAAELSPDLILLDVMMPGMDGFQVCRRLRADSRLAQVPIVIVTALDDRASRLQGIEAGADDFVTKPFDRAELRARVRTITRLNRYRRLLAERAKFEWVVDQSSDGYLIVNNRDSALYANSQARLYVGLPRDQSSPASGTFLELARKQYRFEPEQAWAAWLELSEMAQPRYLVRPESPTANAFWLQVDVLGLPTGLGGDRVIRLRDVTAQMASRRNVWEFHSLVSHKLRTPLGGLFGSLEFLEQEMSGLSQAEMAEFVRIALGSARRLRSETEDIFRYLETSGLLQPDAGVNLSQLQPVVTKISADLGLESVTMMVPQDPDDPRIMLSESVIELVLWEILENAIKFHPRQAPAVEVVLSRLNGAVISLQVRDDGMTLSPEQLARAWIPYYQGEKYFTGHVTGMGLGLSMVASLIWSVGGTCRMYNREDGPGVVVELGLPVAE